MSESISLPQLHKMETEVLQVFHDFCEEHHLTYYLFAGTLLGAVRHKGFIPWDDDVDVLMPRVDYEKFLTLFPKYNKLTHIKLATIDTPHYYVPIAKIYDSRFRTNEPKLHDPCPLGPWVDIFPLDNMGNTFEQAEKLQKKVFLWHRIRNWKATETGYKNFKCMLKTMIRWLLLPVPMRFFLQHIDNIAQCYASDTFTKYVFNVTLTPYRADKIMLSEWFTGKELHVFENRQFYIPSGWHEILKNFYGDYMTPPPTEKRISHL